MKTKYFMNGVTLLLMVSFLSCTGNGQSEANEIEVTYKKQMVKITPGDASQPPSDAIILFDGSDLNNWVKKDGTAADWEVHDGVFTVMPDSIGRNDIYTTQEFGDIQLHLEFKCPETDQDSGQQKGNSGIFIQGRYEIQILDSFESKTDPNRQCGSMYNQYEPLVNACRKPGEWQTYDIIFTAPRFNNEGSLKTPGKITVLQNGVLIQNCAEISGPTGDVRTTNYKESDLKQPLVLQEHSDLVSFRNIWIRDL